MDSSRFDSMVKTLGQGRSRRAVLRGLLGAAAAGVFGAALAQTAEARTCKEVARRCDRNAECCSGACRRGSCACPVAGLESCGGVTPRLLADAAEFFRKTKAEVVVFSSEPARWPDSCLGCPDPDAGVTCQQVVTPGFRVVVGVAGNVRRLTYHTKRGTDGFVRCERADGSCPAGRPVCGRTCCQEGGECGSYSFSACCAPDSELCFA